MLQNIIIISLGMIIINIIFWTALNFGIAFSIRKLPACIFNPDLAFYKERKFEKGLYIKLRVRKWKDKLPELGHLVGFSKRQMSPNVNIEYVNKFILETCIAELGHLLIGILGFLSLLFAFLLPDPINPFDYMFIFALFAGINFLIQISYVIIQRYNRPRLQRLGRRKQPESKKVGKG